MKQHYRISCPLCGKSSYQKNFDRDNAVKISTQTFRGRANITYEQVLDIGILNEFHNFLVSRIERIYYRLTGIDIRELIIDSRQPLITKTIHSTKVEIPAVYPKITAKIKAHKVVIE